MLLRNKLRPVFFRAQGCAIAISGWLDIDTENIWAAVEDLQSLSLFTQQCGCGEAQSWLSLKSNSEHGLVLVPRALLALTLGERVEFTREVDLYPWDAIERGERAVVGRRDKLTGMVELFLEQHHIKLEDTNNCVACTPHIDLDLLGSIRPYKDKWTAPTFVNLAEYTA